MNDTLTTQTLFPASATSAFKHKTTNGAKSTRKGSDLTRMRPLAAQASETTQQLAFIWRTIYLAGAAAVGVALLYYSFV
jgi:hypothetical protein